MKALLTFVVVFLTFSAVSFAADCDVKGHKFDKFETYSPPGECIQMKCEGEGQITALGCGAVAASPECKHVPEDLKKPYPQCCPRYDC